MSWAALAAKAALFAVLVWICLWWQAVIGGLQRAPQKWSLEEFVVSVGNQPVDIGWRELGQRPSESSAEERHIRLIAHDGELWLRNIAHKRRLSLTTSDHLETFAERFQIPRGSTSRLTVDGGTLTFRNVTADAFDLEVESAGGMTKRTYRYQRGPEGLMRTDHGNWNDVCAQVSTVRWLLNEGRARVVAALDWLEAVMPVYLARLIRSSSELDIATLGGRFDCIESNRKQIGGIGHLPWRSLKLVRNGTMFMVAPFDAATRGRDPIRMAVVRDTGEEDAQTIARGFPEAAWRVNGGSLGRVAQIVAGKTAYAISVETRSATLLVHFRAINNMMLFSAEDCSTDETKKTCPHPLDIENFSLASVDGPAKVTRQCSHDGSRCSIWSSRGNVIGAAALQNDMMGRLEATWRGIAAATALIVAGMIAGGPIIALQRLVPSLRQRAARRSYRTLRPLIFTALSLVLALASTWLAMLGFAIAPLTALQLTIANWLFAGLVLLYGPSGILLGLVWIAVTLLTAVGTINLAEMAIDGDTTRWLIYFLRHRVLVLDFVPPLIIAAASCPPEALRPVLQGFVAGSNGWARLMRFTPAALLVFLFLAWFFVGRQTGFGVFQPVEAGKFAMVLLAATALMAIDPRMRAGRTGIAVASSLVSLALIGCLSAVLLGVPLLRSDWSPALIMSLLFVGILVAFGAVVTFRSFVAQLDAHHARQQVPRVFKPGFSYRWWLKRTSPYICAAVLAVVGLGWLILGSPVASAFTLVTGVHEWKNDTEGRLRALESEALGAARRVVVERVITWVDLDLGRREVETCSFSDRGSSSTAPQSPGVPACYADIEYQLIRSRKVIAAAPCGFADVVHAGPGFAAATGLFAHLFEMVSQAASAMLGATKICNMSRADGDRSVGHGSGPSVRPIDIPVVESDFAGAYLIGRLGLGTAFLFYAAQVLLVSVVIVGFVRVSLVPSGGHLDEVVRRYVAIVLAGAVWLLILQWSFSWSNALGLLPVMGQPMTWLSYATSHHLFMAAPCLLIFVIGLRYGGMRPYAYAPRNPPRSRRARWTRKSLLQQSTSG